MTRPCSLTASLLLAAAGGLLLTSPRPSAAIAPTVHIERPRQEQIVAAPLVRFSGTGTGGDVRLEVFNARDNMRRVSQVTIRPHRGRWNISVTLPYGDYKAEAILVRPGPTRLRDTVTFRVRNQIGGGGPDGAASFQVLTPRNGQVLLNRNVLFSGTSGGVAVKVRLFDGAGRPISDDTLDGRSGRWSTTMTLPVGMSYRAVIERFDGRARREVRFSIAVPPKQPR